MKNGYRTCRNTKCSHCPLNCISCECGDLDNTLFETLAKTIKRYPILLNIKEILMDQLNEEDQSDDDLWR